MLEKIDNFFTHDNKSVGKIENERSLQLELGVFFRGFHLPVQFEKICTVFTHEKQTKRQKRYLDLLVHLNDDVVAIELKVPLAGRVPETMYDFIADIAFVESVVKAGIAKFGFCIMMTDNSQFWKGAKSDGIYSAFRNNGTLHGSYSKPTGAKKSTVYLEGTYPTKWANVHNDKLMLNSRFLIVQIHSS